MKEEAVGQMDSTTAGHSRNVLVSPITVGERAPGGVAFDDEAANDPSPASGTGLHPPRQPSFEELYDEHVDFVWRALRSLGVRDHAVEDAVQDVFLVVHRRLAEFEHRSTLRTWIFGVAMRVAHDHRRREARKGGLSPLDVEIVDRAPRPDERAAQAEALREVAELLDSLDPEKRAIFVLAELEQWTAPEIAEALSINLNTVYSRIRAARRDFEDAYARRRDERK
jgi:RNA polymerase sigma-70 factor (ECF subfamily)